MNEHSLNDPKLQSFEARLAAKVPQLSPFQQQHLLYQCAFAAGQKTAGRSLRRWQAFAAALVVLLLGVSIPLAQDRLLIAKRTVEPIVPAEVTPQQMVAQSEIPIIARQSATIELDAWQTQPSSSALLTDELACFERTDPHLRSLAVGTLSRAFLKP
ncbi:MAG: hypothetical protein EXS05_20830 [Planctomycetaceae bacterium]|nr:hypothetical protein [Planctomycetaceae bacterium]